MSPHEAVAAVRQVFQQYVDDWNAPNIDAVLAILADDVVQMPPDTVIVGKEALSADWRQYLEENADVWEPTIDDPSPLMAKALRSFVGTLLADGNWCLNSGSSGNQACDTGVAAPSPQFTARPRAGRRAFGKRVAYFWRVVPKI
jgi:hypothetical protein